MSAGDIVKAIGPECHEGVTRRGEFQPCDKPAVAIRLDPDFGDPYRVCAQHARTADLMVPLDLIDEAVRAQVAQRIRAWVRHGRAVPADVTTYDRRVVNDELDALADEIARPSP